jgi:DNA-binding NarL/FixJ family response regulator
MPTDPTQRRRVLFVDDEPAFLDMIQRAASLWSKDVWNLHLANTASKALSVLQAEAIDLVVIDIQMPVVDGLQFLGLLHRKYPQLQKVVLTGFATENYRAACLSGGAELFLEKPRTVEGLEAIFATLRELARWNPAQGFRGLLRQVGLQDVIQLECLSRHSAVLEITTGEWRGEIFIKDGAIIHAHIAGQSGETAFNRLLALQGGEFNLKPYVDPPSVSIEGSWEFLVMEASRLRDEATQAEPASAGREAAAPNPPAPFPAGLGPGQPPAQDQTPPVLRLVGQEPTSSGARPSDSPYPAPGPAAALQPGQPRIEEVLISSVHGSVVYEWQCNDSSDRLRLLDFVTKKSKQLTQSLPLGPCDRLVLQTGKGRLVMHLQNAHAILVRSYRPAEIGVAPVQ